ncbi:hypothetical protein Y695_04915 [Hydrogenophaga sp. T4]|nr:hypothetical protein Y695_04915 [Hydrogenophaga sp. T4]
MGSVRPSRPPQSCTTSTTWCRSSRSTSSSSTCRCQVKLWAPSFLGLSLLPKPIRSGATTRAPLAANTGIIFRYR